VNYHKDLAKATTGQEWRSDMQPINITQPQGPSFSIEGNLVSVLVGTGQQQKQQQQQQQY
jgi:Cu2+-containing amine oxidase